MHDPLDLSYLADTVLLTRHFEANGTVRQAIAVLKKRYAAHERTIHELQIDAQGIRVGAALAGLRGVLSGNPVSQGDLPALEGAAQRQEQPPPVQFTVSDNGAGIDPVFHPRIFEIFQTLKPCDEVEGSGMGLTVVKRLVEGRGGTIQVLSSPGAGAAFRFTWPVASSAR